MNKKKMHAWKNIFFALKFGTVVESFNLLATCLHLSVLSLFGETSRKQPYPTKQSSKKCPPTASESKSKCNSFIIQAIG